MYLKSIVDTSFSGSISASNFHSGLCSMRAHRSHRALVMAATAKWITPFSGPTCQGTKQSKKNVCHVHVSDVSIVLQKISLVGVVLIAVNECDGSTAPSGNDAPHPTNIARRQDVHHSPISFGTEKWGRATCRQSRRRSFWVTFQPLRPTETLPPPPLPNKI